MVEILAKMFWRSLVVSIVTCLLAVLAIRLVIWIVSP